MYEIEQNRTALIIPILEAAPHIQPFREKYIPTPAAAMPPHITIYGPFIPMQHLDENLVAMLTTFFAVQSSFNFALEKLGRFSDKGVLYLSPEPSKPLYDLRQTLQRQFIDKLPADFHPNRTMHLTLARCPAEKLDEIEALFYQKHSEGLPINVFVDTVCVYEKKGTVWHKQREFGLGSGAEGKTNEKPEKGIR